VSRIRYRLVHALTRGGLLGATLLLGSCDTGQTCPECPECPAKAECPECPAPTAAGDCTEHKPDKGDIKLTFRESKRASSKAWADKMRKAEVFDRLIDAINDTIALPRNAAVLVADCGRIDAYYDLKAPGVVICYELLDHFALVARWDDMADRLIERYRGLAARLVMYTAKQSIRENPATLGKWSEIARAVRAA